MITLKMIQEVHSSNNVVHHPQDFSLQVERLKVFPLLRNQLIYGLIIIELNFVKLRHIDCFFILVDEVSELDFLLKENLSEVCWHIIEVDSHNIAVLQWIDCEAVQLYKCWNVVVLFSDVGDVRVCLELLSRFEYKLLDCYLFAEFVASNHLYEAKSTIIVFSQDMDIVFVFALCAAVCTHIKGSLGI